MNKNNYMIQFLQAYLDFANNINNPYDFNPSEGLCNALFQYFKYDLYQFTDPDWEFYDLKQMLHDRLYRYNPTGWNYPFGETEYHESFAEGNQHKCPKRITFVKDYLKELQND